MTTKHRLGKLTRLMSLRESAHASERITGEVAKRLLLAVESGQELERSGTWCEQHENYLQLLNLEAQRNGY